MIKKIDWILTATVLTLCLIGVLFLYNFSKNKGDFLFFKKQIFFLIIGLILMFIFSFLDYRIFKNDPYLLLILYFVSVLSLLGLFFFAPQIRGVKGWYKIGSFSLDPIEFTKIVLILLLSKYFSTRHIELYNIWHIILSGIYIGLPSILIFLQPDVGSLIIIVGIWISILIISGVRIRTFLILVCCLILIFTISWIFFLKDYQKARILSFLFPGRDPLGIEWSQRQSKIALGTGGWKGEGLGKGFQVHYGFLTEPQTDFIFAGIGEEFGFLGTSLIYLLYLYILQRILKIAINSKDNFSRLFCTGFAVLIALEVLINTGMNLGILPVIGISLPFLSYGGSGLIGLFIGLGIVQNIKINQ